MKLNRFFAMAAIGLLMIGGMGFVATRSFALGTHTQVASVSAQADACAQDQADGAEVTSGADTDNVELQCGDQNTPDTGDEAAEEQETIGAADTDNVQEQVGDQTGPDTGVEAPETNTNK